ncbi:MAG: bah 1 [Marmoricola sp.]|nr:bah 1 [Marmoricola sp.]
MKLRHRVPGVVLRTVMSLAARWSLRPGTNWDQRRWWSAVAARVGRVPHGVRVESGRLGDLACEITAPSTMRDGLVLLYLHGGGWTVGSPASHRSLVARLAALTGMRTWSIDYRLAPEHPFPAALDDCVAAYQALLDAGHERIVVAGDSAGGGLTASLGVAVRDRGLVAPAALGMLCPVVYVTRSALDRVVDSHREPLLTSRVLTEMFDAYVGTHDRSDPLLSPLYADLAGLPPVVLDSAADDLLGDQDVAFAQAISAAGGTLDHRHYPGLWHVFHALAGIWPVATEALECFADRLVAAAG